MSAPLYSAAVCVTLLLYMYVQIAQATVQFSRFGHSSDHLSVTESGVFNLSSSSSSSNNNRQSTFFYGKYEYPDIVDNNKNNRKVRSLLDCARLCASHADCGTFSYVKETTGTSSCLGRSKTMTSANVQKVVSSARTYMLALQAVTDPCLPENHIRVDDVRRDVTNTDSPYTLCDLGNAWTEGWRRFLLNGSDADMLTSCPETTRRCGTHVPMWLDLQNATPPEAGHAASVNVCPRYDRDCCFPSWTTTATVRNCGCFMVYNLPKAASCYLAYCAKLRV